MTDAVAIVNVTPTDRGLFPSTMGATFSPCRQWRYLLWRIWNPDLPMALFILMNPSKADEVENDPTVTRQQVRVMKWAELEFDLPRFGGVVVANAFGWRETDSRLLKVRIKEGVDIIGPDNDRHILEAAKSAGIAVCGWGQPGNLLGRGKVITEMLAGAGIKLHALRIAKDGTPWHPLYLGYDLKPIPMEPA
jgi:hypothetical protein